MSIVDEAIAAITPMESAEERATARSTAREATTPGDWLSQILDHHVALEQAFADVKGASDAEARKTGLKALGVLITGHAIAEEAVIYPAMAQGGEKGHATHAYNEQVMVKMEMAKLEQLDPMSQEFLDKVEAIQSAVAHHMYEEEGTWFPELRRESSVDQQMLTTRYSEEFDRYTGGNGDGGSNPPSAMGF